MAWSKAGGLGLLEVGAVLLPTALTGQHIISTGPGPHMELTIVLDTLHVADTATFHWVGSEPRLVLNPAAGPSALHEALHHLSRYMWQCDHELEPFGGDLKLPVGVDPPQNGSLDMWQYLVDKPPTALAGIDHQVRVLQIGFRVGEKQTPARSLRGVKCIKKSGSEDLSRTHSR